MNRKLLFTFIIFIIQYTVTAQCWQTIESGNHHCYSIRTDGTLWAWGDNELGVLGDSSSLDQTKPIQLGNSNQWKIISANDHHATGIHFNGTLWGFGDNREGVLGNGTTITRIKPFQISSATNWKDVSAGEYFTLALKTDGTLWAWGANSSGQLGNGNNIASNIPVQVGNASNWTMISAGRSHCLALNSSGELWNWGANIFGEVGIGKTSSGLGESTPIKLTGTWKYISAGIYCSYGIKSDGSIWGWGHNAFGQIDVSGNDILVPTQIGNGLTWVNVSASEHHVAAIRADGTLWTWGRNNYGQLGDGSKTNTTNGPIQIGSDTDWKYTISARSSTLALKMDGTLYAWGWNKNGQQGDGTKVDKIVPTQVICATTSINNIDNNFTFNIYPNPVFENSFSISSNINSGFIMHDYTGKQVHFGELVQGNNLIEIPQCLNNGIYFIQIGNTIQKIVINQ